MSKRIEEELRKALIQNGAMTKALFEYELAEYVDYWYEGLKADRNEFVFAVTENSGQTAMVLITKEKIIYVNEMARRKLSKIWGESYLSNMKMLIPGMAEQLAHNIIAVNGVTLATSWQSSQ
ncbi:MAG TPA: hypothetical protein P5526_26800 [Anaerolineae bacterium]|nr:hypothetical protein [Anaerolineae bacterium]MCB0180607.1 hypothetical protein [Anaerolineae bacterium]MCB9105779.1 hypothetical protein [Anaerolineales bacterium]HRV95792.1 hypothetical protein [Anaerolineae bacterium]